MHRDRTARPKPMRLATPLASLTSGVRRCVALMLDLLIAGGCARTGLLDFETTGSSMDPSIDRSKPSGSPYSMTQPDDDLCPASRFADPGCRAEMVEGKAGLCNDLDDDCDGTVDEGCPCAPGSVKSCFAGPPRRRGIGACQDGLQQCQSSADGVGAYGPCLGGIQPQPEVCDSLDNDCNGCRDDLINCIPGGSCPGPSDPRIQTLRPFEVLELHAKDYYPDDVAAYSWAVEGGPCDRAAPTGKTSFEFSGASSETARFVPKLSGEYSVRFSLVTRAGEKFACNWIIPVRGPGLRIEMCYPESDRLDLDLYLKRLSTPTPWFYANATYSPNLDACAWHNCEATLRGQQMEPPQDVSRADWGYAESPISECEGGPLGREWRNLGYCPNPRLDIDNNLSQGTGLPENINIDQPRDGDGFRIMVQNFSGGLAKPIVNVYCAGRRVATFGTEPDVVPNFSGSRGSSSVGAMWRVADVVTHVSGDGYTDCTVTALHPKGKTSGYNVTKGDASF